MLSAVLSADNMNKHVHVPLHQIPSPNERLSLKDLAAPSGDNRDCKR